MPPAPDELLEALLDALVDDVLDDVLDDEALLDATLLPPPGPLETLQSQAS